MSRPHSFRAMGCDVLVGNASAGEAAAIERLFAARERTFSRFIPGSELNRVNDAAGRVVRVSRELARALQLALAAAASTDGLVDPSLGAALEAAGYDRDFDQLEPDESPAGTAARGRWRELRLSGRLLQVPAGVRLDLNGVVKGLAVDDALHMLEHDSWVSAGGDLATRAPLDVELPGGGAVRVVRGAIATSGSARRRWLRGGAVQHHLIDPRTGLPGASRWAQVTVVGATCVAADIAAKAAFLLDLDGPAWLDAHGLPGRLLDHDGGTVASAAWSAMLKEPACT